MDTDTQETFSWQVTKKKDGIVTVVVGDDWPANDGTNGPKLTEASYDALTFHIIGKTLRQLGDHLIEQSYAQGDDPFEDDDWGDDED